MALPVYDCTRCGACCFNPPENVAEGYTEYIEVGPRDELRKKPQLLRRYVHEHAGRMHLQLLADQRCKALQGALGKHVRCSIYAFRPSPCRRVEAGSELCRRYRKDQALGA